MLLAKYAWGKLISLTMRTIYSMNITSVVSLGGLTNLMGSMGEEAITSGIEWDEMSPKQKVIREQIQRWFWTLNENNFIQNEMGLLNEDLWAQVERYIYARYSECHLRSIYKGMVSYRPLIDYIDDLPDRCAQ